MKQIANKKPLKYLPMRNLLILLCPFFVTTSLLAQDATIAYRDTDDMFIGKIETGTNAPLPPPSKTFNFIKSYSLKIRWRTYLGEPLERYEFGWKRNNGYSINVDGKQRTIIEDSLRKYPDLIDRFYRIRPTRVDIKLEGTAGGRTKDEMGAFGVGRLNIPGEGTVDFVSYNYIVKDDDLLIGRSGNPKSQWVDSAPETWNEFLNWTGQYGTDLFNMPTNEFKRLSSEEQSKRLKDIKTIWKQINAISISGSIENIEWPEQEMIDIIKTYDRYKNKKKSKDKDKEDDFWNGENEKVVNDKEKISLEDLNSQLELVSKEARSLEDVNTTYNVTFEEIFSKKTTTKNSNNQLDDSFLGNDNNAEENNENLDFLTQETVTQKNKTNFKIDYKNGLQGVINPETKKILIPYKEWSIEKFQDGIAKVSITIESENVCSCFRGYYQASVMEVGYVDNQGKFIDGSKKVITGSFKSEVKLMLVKGNYSGSDRKRDELRHKKEAIECVKQGKQWKIDAKRRYL